MLGEGHWICPIDFGDQSLSFKSRISGGCAFAGAGASRKNVAAAIKRCLNTGELLRELGIHRPLGFRQSSER